MADRLFMGLDSGTQGTKGVVISEKQRCIVAQASYAHELIENDRGGREQEPRDWIEAGRHVIGKLLADTNVDCNGIHAIGVSGQQHGMVPLDGNGNVLRPAKLWCDTETVEQCDTLTHRVGGKSEGVKLMGNQFSAGFTASKILWLKEKEPENYDKLATVLLPHDFINFWLTGNCFTECGDASGTAYFDIKNRCWSREVLQAIDPDRDLLSCLPEVIDSSQPAGIVSNEVADSLGLPRGVLVSSGGGDNMMAAIGTGNVVRGVVTASLGTSGTIYSYSDSPVIDRFGELAAFCSSSGGWLPLVCTMNVTVATELIRSLLGLSLEEMNREIERTPEGSEGLMLIPYFNGERTPALPHATATLSGITGLNMRPGPIARAAIEGATYGLRYGLEVMKRNGIIAEEVRLVGGGAKNAIWRQLVADLFNCPIVCPKNDEAGAAGAAIQALWCTANVQNSASVDLKEITDLYVELDENKRCEPNAAQVDMYNVLYERYQELGACLLSTYEER